MKSSSATCCRAARRMVVKVGSNVLTQDQGLNLKALNAISRQICHLIDQKVEVILVSSGAMAAGMKKIGLNSRPDGIPQRQAVAAVGQAGLIQAYEKAFARYDKQVAQILLTSEDLTNRQRYLNGRNALYALLSWQVVPIVNENDTVMVEEIQVGDNDNLAAMITLLMDADLLVILSDIDGLFTRDPRVHDDAELIPEVSTFKRRLEQFASDIPGPLGRGGMLSKIRAAKKVTAAGVPMIIASGNKPDVLKKIFAGKPQGTFFVPRTERLASRKSWIAFTLKPQGNLTLDAGAVRAIVGNGKSLLPSGIVAVAGEFRKGAPVTLADAAGQTLGTGLVNYGAGDIRKIMGQKTGRIVDLLGEKPYDEVVHRDNLVLNMED